MRIHTSLQRNDMYDALKNSGAPIHFEVLERHASKTHDRAFELRLSGTGGKTNSGRYGAGEFPGATWDEWGAFFGALYDADPEARCGGSVKSPVYANAKDYHYKTGDRFHNIVKWSPRLEDYLPSYLPADTHPRHHWDLVWEDLSFACTKCSATRPPNVPRSYAA